MKIIQHFAKSVFHVFFFGNKNYWLFAIRLQFPQLFTGQKQQTETEWLWRIDAQGQDPKQMDDVTILFEI